MYGMAEIQQTNGFVAVVKLGDLVPDVKCEEFQSVEERVNHGIQSFGPHKIVLFVSILFWGVRNMSFPKWPHQPKSLEEPSSKELNIHGFFRQLTYRSCCIKDMNVRAKF